MYFPAVPLFRPPTTSSRRHFKDHLSPNQTTAPPPHPLCTPPSPWYTVMSQDHQCLWGRAFVIIPLHCCRKIYSVVNQEIPLAVVRSRNEHRVVGYRRSPCLVGSVGHFIDLLADTVACGLARFVRSEFAFPVRYPRAFGFKSHLHFSPRHLHNI